MHGHSTAKGHRQRTFERAMTSPSRSAGSFGVGGGGGPPAPLMLPPPPTTEQSKTRACSSRTATDTDSPLIVPRGIACDRVVAPQRAALSTSAPGLCAQLRGPIARAALKL